MRIDGIETPDTPSPRKPVRLLLGNLTASRKTMARIIRAYSTGILEDAKYKGLIYGLSGYLAFLRFEKEIDIEKRLDALEAARIAADIAESAARVAADNTNAGYHDGSTESALKIELVSPLPAPGAAYNGRLVRVETTSFVAGKIHTISGVYVCLYARSDTVSGYTWVKIASYSI